MASTIIITSEHQTYSVSANFLFPTSENCYLAF